MKKVLLALTLVFAVFFASAKTVPATKSIELQSNMMISKEAKVAKKGWEYLGVYDVYVNGVYQGTYHVWVYREEAVAV